MCGDEHYSVGDEHTYAGDKHSPVGDEHRHVCGDEHKNNKQTDLPAALYIERKIWKVYANQTISKQSNKTILSFYTLYNGRQNFPSTLGKNTSFSSVSF